MIKLTENQISFLNDFKELYGLDLSNYVDPGRSNTNAATLMVAKLSENDIGALKRFCVSRGIRLEPNGYKIMAVFV